MYPIIKYSTLLCFIFFLNSFANDSIFRGVGLKYGYRKYTYKTYEIAYEHKSFLFSKRPEDNPLVGVFSNLNIGNQIDFLPSLEFWKTQFNTDVVVNADFSYNPYKSTKFYLSPGFGFGYHRASHSENKNLINLNVFIIGYYNLSKTLSLTSELRLLSYIHGENLDNYPIIFTLGLKYNLGKLHYDQEVNNIGRYGFYSVFIAGFTLRLIGLILQAGLPYS